MSLVDASPPGDADLRHRRNILLVPALLATFLDVVLLGLSLLVWVVAEIWSHSHPGLFHQPGITYVAPSGAERTKIVAQHIGPVLAGVGLLILTWRYRNQGRRAATWISSAGAVLVGVASLFW